MKSLFILLFTIFFNFSSQIFSQYGWAVQSYGYNYELECVHFINPNTGWAGGWYIGQPSKGLICKTTNGGAYWNTAFYIGNLWHHINSIYFLNENSGWIATDSIGWGVIKKSTNGGSNWFNQYSIFNNKLYSLYFLDQNTAWAVGGGSGATIDDGFVCKTTNGGINWNLISTIHVAHPMKVQFIDANTGWAGGYGDLSFKGLYKTTNGGANWMIADTSLCTDFFFIDANTGWELVDHVGNINKTTDGGGNWTRMYTSEFEEFLRSIQFINQDTGWAVGGSYQYYPYPIRIVATRDGGANWVHQWTPLGSQVWHLYSMFFVNDNTGWAVGGNLTIIKTTTGGEVGTEAERQSVPVPDKFFLHQNYPNPFNPSTVIGFDIPKVSFIKLAVYDVLGKEIEILANENLDAGSYRVEWNASAYPSGVYFYKLITDGFTETRKMVLMK